MSLGMPQTAIMQGFLGEIRIFAGKYAPDNWAFCQGQLLPIANNESLFSLLGVAFGGDGRSTFALPDTRGRIMIGMFQGQGLSERTLGEVGGQETVSLTEAEMPKHNHSILKSSSWGMGSYTPPAYNGDVGDTNSPLDAVFALEDEGNGVYNTSLTPPTSETGSWSENLNTTANVATAGNGQGHNNMMPVFGVNYIICTSGGEYPRN